MTNWAYAHQYVDMMFYAGDATYSAAVRSGGIKTVAYVDPNLCSGNFPTGANPYAGPDCSGLTSDAFYTQPGNPNNALSVSYNNQILQKYGNPASSSLQAALLKQVQNIIAADGPQDYIEIDDATTPPEYGVWGSPMCWGAGQFANGSYSCTGAPGGSAASPYGTVYNKAQWQAGESAMAAQMPLPVFYNGLQKTDNQESTAAIASVVASSSNVWGGMCETCFYGDNSGNQWAWSDAVLNVNLASIMAAINGGRTAMVANTVVLDTTRRAGALADVMLVYDPDKLWLAGDQCGSISHIHACAEQSLTFYQPIGGYPTSVSQLQSSTGAYVREFAACYNRGVLIGPCASVVNPKPTSTVSMPTLSKVYQHTLVISGTGPCNCYGDSGSVAYNGPAAPSVLPAASAYVLFL